MSRRPEHRGNPSVPLTTDPIERARHIYEKLDAHSRTEAVARGRQLGLLAPVSRLG
jgi:hypothetical protein